MTSGVTAKPTASDSLHFASQYNGIKHRQYVFEFFDSKGSQAKATALSQPGLASGTADALGWTAAKRHRVRTGTDASTKGVGMASEQAGILDVSIRLALEFVTLK